jgi:hypothetical protein
VNLRLYFTVPDGSYLAGFSKQYAINQFNWMQEGMYYFAAFSVAKTCD